MRNGFGFCLLQSFSLALVAHESRMERAKRDVGFVAAWDGLGFDWRLWSAKHDVGVCDAGLHCCMSPFYSQPYLFCLGDVAAPRSIMFFATPHHSRIGLFLIPFLL